MTDSTVKLGTVIAERYSIVAAISQGPAANVYRAADLSDGGKPVAIKIVCGDQGAEVLEEFFSREVDSLRRLRHASVVRLLDTGTDATVGRWLALEWLERGTLADTEWRTRYREPVRLLELMKDLLSALAAAHHNGIVHRDIKPSNVLFDQNGTAKLADFNVSKLFGRTRSTKTVRHFFTAKWASPEQRSGKPSDERTDVFALGKMCAELVTGDDGDDLSNLLFHLDEARAPGPLRKLLRRMLSEGIANRPTATEALQDVEAILDSMQPQPCLALRLTIKVTDTLSNLQGVPATPKDVLDLVRLDLGGRVHVELTTRASNRGGTTYTFIGKRYSFLVVASESADRSADEMTIVGVIALPPQQRENSRSGALALPFVADVIAIGSSPRQGEAVAIFEASFSEAKTLKLASRQGDYISEGTIEAWESYLELARALKDARTRIGSVRRAVERDGFIGCDMYDMTVAPEQLVDAGVNFMAPNGRMLRLGIITEASPTHLVIRPYDDVADDVELPEGGFIVHDARMEEASLQRQATAIRMVRQRTDVEGDLLELLARPDRAVPPARVTIQPRTENLDASNRAVVEHALGTDRLYLVQGPPGTGKTTVIAELITQILECESDSRILLVSQSNVAIDNVLERLHVLAPEAPIVRLGRAEKVSDAAKHLMLRDRLSAEALGLRAKAGLAKERLAQLSLQDSGAVEWVRSQLSAASMSTGDRQSARELAADMVGFPIRDTDENLARRLYAAKSLLDGGESYVGDLLQLQAQWLEQMQASDELEQLMLQSIRVIAGTCVGVVQNRAVADARFDWVIVDEAGRASPPELLVPLVRGRRLVLLGDHRQLPPVLDDEVTAQVVERLGLPKERLERSLFEDLFQGVQSGTRVRLRQQYRMRPDIGGLIEAVFYPEGLTHAVTEGDRPLATKLWGAALRWLDTACVKYAEERAVGKSFMNRAEVSVILKDLALIPALLRGTTDRVSVGVLTAYSAQRQALEDAVSSRREGWPEIDVAVLTVDAAQGREYDLVYYSAVRANPRGDIGFLRDKRRLNVALSRAKHGLTIVGDMGALVMAGTSSGSNAFIGIQSWMRKAPESRPVVRLANS